MSDSEQDPELVEESRTQDSDVAPPREAPPTQLMQTNDCPLEADRRLFGTFQLRLRRQTLTTHRGEAPRKP